jgi:hypothetical protein
MRYCTIDIPVGLLSNFLGDQAKITRFISIPDHGGGTVRCLVKAQDAILPEGATLSTATDLPHREYRLVNRGVQIEFVS